MIISSIPESYINNLSMLYTNLQVSKLNISPEVLASLNPNF